METAVPGQIKHAFRQSGLSEIRTGLEVSGDIASNGTVYSQNEACLTGIQAYTKTEVNNALALKAPLASPALTGTATASNLTVSTNLLIGATNVMTSLNSKANASDVYTRAQIISAFQPLIDSFTAPLKYTESILTGINTLSIDPEAILTIGDIDSSGTLTIDTIEAKAANHVRFTNNVLVEGNLDAELDISCRKLTVTEFHPIKPYIALYVAGNAISTSTAVGYLAPSNFTMTRVGAGLYTFNFTPAH
jgi:hypothetical protein